MVIDACTHVKNREREKQWERERGTAIVLVSKVIFEK
jgi:hypothetical protein